MTARRRDRGYLVVDAVLGLTVIAALLALLAAAVTQMQRGTKAMAEQRLALAAAEEALAAMRQGVPQPAADAEVELVPIDAAAPEGWRWVRATGVVSERRASLTGLVPAGAVPPLEVER